MKTARRVVSRSLPVLRPLVDPADDNPKTGCMWCPLMPLSADFRHFEQAYKRANPERIIEALKEPHVIRNRNVHESPWSPVDVLFVGEAPGADEDKQATPFVGQSGKLLRGTLAEIAPNLSYGCANVVRCFVPGTPVVVKDVRKAYRRLYRGPVVRLTLRSGHKLTGTPNHPVLTEKGWVALARLNCGDNVASGVAGEGVCSVYPNEHDKPAPIEQVFESLSQDGVRERIGGRPVDFHGDGRHGEIDVVSTDDVLRSRLYAEPFKHLRHLDFAMPDVPAVKPTRCFCHSAGFTQSRGVSLHPAARCDPRVTREAASLRGSHLGESYRHCVAGCTDMLLNSAKYGRFTQTERAGNLTAGLAGQVTRSYFGHGGVGQLFSLSPRHFERFGLGPDSFSGFAQSGSDGVGGRTDGDGDFLKGLPAPVQFDQVINVEILAYAGHVFTFETDCGYYWAGGVITSNCRPPLNREPSKTEKTCCEAELFREIKARKPKVLVPLGNHSLSFIMGHTGIMAVAGAVTRCHKPGLEDVVVVPCFHPAYVLRQDHMFDRFVEILDTAVQVARGERKVGKGHGDYYVVDDPDAVVDLMAHFRKQKALVSFDTETGGLSPFQEKHPPLLCLSFSDEDGVGYVVPLDHPESPWTLYPPQPTLESMPPLPDEPHNPRIKEPKSKKAIAQRAAWLEWKAKDDAHREKLLQQAIKSRELTIKRNRPVCAKVETALKGFFADASVPKVAQNEKFDRQHIRHRLGVEVEGQVWDTLLHHLVVEDQSGTHGLGVLAYRYTGMGGYHVPLENYVKEHPECAESYALIPAAELFPYAAADADVTRRVIHAIREEQAFTGRNQMLAEHFFPRLSRTISNLEYEGAAVDMTVVERLRKSLTMEVNAAMQKIKAMPRVREYEAANLAAKKREPDFNPGSDRQVGEVLWDYYGLSPVELTTMGEKILFSRYARLQKERDDDTLSFASVVQDSIRRREWDLFSTKADVLYEYEHGGNDLAPLLLEYRDKSKLLTTYVEPIVERLDKDGRVHGSFNIIGTVTGRLCVASDTLIDTSVGKFEISKLPDVLRGNPVFVKSHNGNWCRVVDAFPKGYEPMLRIRCANGSTVDCTTKHRILTAAGWRHAGDLEVGSQVCTDVAMLNENRSTTNRNQSRAETEHRSGVRRSSVVCDFAESERVARVAVAGYASGGGLRDSSASFAGGSGRRVSPLAGRHTFRSSEVGVGVAEWLDATSLRHGSDCEECASGGAIDWGITEIVSVEPLGVREVWDLTVESDHSYWAQGLCHHNSSNGPNLQNLPVVAKLAYVSRFGADGLILEADYSQIELRVAACLYRDPQMIHAYQKGIDNHRITAIQISGLTEHDFDLLDKHKAKEWRVRAKRVNFGIIYGISAIGLQRTLKKEGVFITLQEAEEMLEAFKRAKPKLMAGIARVEDEAKRNGYLTSFTGRVRRLPEVNSDDFSVVSRALRQAVNFPVQSAAADMTLMSMCIIDELLRKEKMQSRVIATVHDSLVTDTHKSETVYVAKTQKAVMQSIHELSDLVLPQLDWGWLQVPLVAEFAAGQSWGSTVEFDPDVLDSGVRSDKPLIFTDVAGKQELRKPVTFAELLEAAQWMHDKELSGL